MRRAISRGEADCGLAACPFADQRQVATGRGQSAIWPAAKTVPWRTNRTTRSNSSSSMSPMGRNARQSSPALPPSWSRKCARVRGRRGGRHQDAVTRQFKGAGGAAVAGKAGEYGPRQDVEKRLVRRNCEYPRRWASSVALSVSAASATAMASGVPHGAIASTVPMPNSRPCRWPGPTAGSSRTCRPARRQKAADEPG